MEEQIFNFIQKYITVESAVIASVILIGCIGFLITLSKTLYERIKEIHKEKQLLIEDIKELNKEIRGMQEKFYMENRGLYDKYYEAMEKISETLNNLSNKL